MNRSQRRTVARIQRVHHSRTHHEKLTHTLAPQACVLYVPGGVVAHEFGGVEVPSGGGYVAEFSPIMFRLVEFPSLAPLYCEDEATRAALIFREITGLPVKIRPYYCPHVQQ